jgi:hypothetical protein
MKYEAGVSKQHICIRFIIFFIVISLIFAYLKYKHGLKFFFVKKTIEEGYFEYGNFEFENGNFEKQSGEL